ncbi:hypothetical protein BC835DRAFT_1412043 [Cytidiella melzeri]|nr:hypothetical protein BC835DRAFT_1412043 [Cytidiella melzeri]
MWCTRWYLPLVLLPLPIAPPYFLALFLFSTTLHAKPCFYCILLLTALFMASCYWPPVPIDTALHTPWSDSVVTFSDALISRMPGLPLDMIPATIQIADRCWCDFSEGFFEPYNTTQWEVNSVEGLKRQLERQMRERGISLQVDAGVQIAGVADATAQGNSSLQTEIENKYKAFSSSLRNMWDMINLSSHATANSSSPSQDTAHKAKLSLPQLTLPSGASSLSTSNSRLLSSPWTEYDLRSYGFDMIIDLRWAP